MQDIPLADMAKHRSGERGGSFRDRDRRCGKPNRQFAEFDIGAMPQFERLDDVVASYDAFVAKVG